MAPLALVILIAGIVVVLYDAVLATASRKFGFPYVWGVAGSYLVYVVSGFLGAWAAGSAWAGILAGGAVGLIEATLGWYVSWVIGPGRPPVPLGPSAIARIVLFVSLEAAALGLAGGAIAHLTGST